MDLDAFDYPLPEDRVALRPARPRDSARVLTCASDGALGEALVRDLPGLLRAGDLMVFNDTRVIRAALKAVRPARAQGGADVNLDVLIHQRRGPDRWRAFARPAKRLNLGDSLLFPAGLAGDVAAKLETGEIEIQFDRADAALDAAIAAAGAAPLPPYIADRRAPDAADTEDYQTIYAAQDGSVAAPTAGLHFTEGVMAALAAAGVGRAFVTLHVGAGTFLPVKTANLDDHVMHAEWRCVPMETIAAIAATKAAGGRVIAVGTTALRSLESAAAAEGTLAPIAGETDLFIRPGFKFTICDGLWTNFHMPRSTLLMLVAAFIGMDRMRMVYAEALARGFRFYSYGDASLLWRADG